MDKLIKTAKEILQTLFTVIVILFFVGRPAYNFIYKRVSKTDKEQAKSALTIALPNLESEIKEGIRKKYPKMADHPSNYKYRFQKTDSEGVILVQYGVYDIYGGTNGIGFEEIFMDKHASIFYSFSVNLETGKVTIIEP